MKREQFLRVLRQEARALKLAFRVDRVAGKGSHYRVHIGKRFSIVQSGELTPVMMKVIRKQLDLK